MDNAIPEPMDRETFIDSLAEPPMPELTQNEFSNLSDKLLVAMATDHAQLTKEQLVGTLQTLVKKMPPKQLFIASIEYAYGLHILNEKNKNN